MKTPKQTRRRRPSPKDGRPETELNYEFRLRLFQLRLLFDEIEVSDAFEDVSGLRHIGDKIISTLECMARGGDAHASEAIISLARTGAESFHGLAESHPDTCKKVLSNAETMPALLSPLPSVAKKFEELKQKLGLGSSHRLHGKNWDYYNGVNRFVSNCIGEIDNVRGICALFPNTYSDEGPQSALAQACRSLPELSRREDVQRAWRRAIKLLIRAKESSPGAHLFDFAKLPAFKQGWTRARVKQKHSNAALFRAECWKDIARALRSLAD